MKRAVFLVTAFLFFLLSGSSLALSDQQRELFGLGINYFDTDDNPSGCAVGLGINLSGNSNQEKSFNFFVAQGLSANQAAGIVGNLMWESSGIVPNLIQGGHTSSNPADAGSGGYGIAQWTPGSKLQSVVTAANIKGPVNTLPVQLQALWAQLSGNAGSYSEAQAGSDIKGTTSLEDAVRAFQGDINAGGRFTGFERPKDERATLDDRTNLARQTLELYGGGAPAGTSPADNTSSDCAVTGAGEDTRYVDGFTTYSQYDKTWANKPYGNSTIAASGCGPSAMAMIITSLTGKTVTPVQTANYADANGLYISGAGSSWSIGPVLAKHWGLNSEQIGASIPKISSALQSGSLVIVAGRGPVPFTSGGHFIVIKAVKADGKWMVGDSAHPEANSKEWDPQQILDSIVSNGSDGSVYAISK